MRVFALAVASALGCATGGPEASHESDAARDDVALRARHEALAAALDAAPLPADAAVVMRLAFEAAADLDLYGTDPTQESVYFGNARSASGGRLQADRRCGDPAPRIEVATWPRASAGTWRLGVDHPERCDDDAAPAAFVAEIIAPGARRRVTGTIPLHHFDLRPLQLELEGRGLERDTPPR